MQGICEACGKPGKYREDYEAFLCDTHAEFSSYAKPPRPVRGPPVPYVPPRLSFRELAVGVAVVAALLPLLAWFFVRDRWERFRGRA